MNAEIWSVIFLLVHTIQNSKLTSNFDIYFIFIFFQVFQYQMLRTFKAARVHGDKKLCK